VSTFKSACPLNCFDTCSLLVEVRSGKVVGATGDAAHPQTGGFVCPKINRMIRRLNGPDRLTSPLLKRSGGWEKISWERAFDLLTENLGLIREEFGTLALLHQQDSGSNGLLKTLSRRFFNLWGGVTQTRGSLCWSAGVAAQKLDFGGCRAHTWEDLNNSRTILLWGRDPARTNLHLVPYLRKARERGAKVVVINPVGIKSARLAHWQITPCPGTDGALALGIAHFMLKERWLDLRFIADHVLGFEEFARLVRQYNPERVEQITGVSVAEQESLARLIALEKPAAIVLGYGMQRYFNGGQTVRAIDALAAITGNIGLAGGGVHYAFVYAKRELLGDLTAQKQARSRRTISYPRWGEEVLNLDSPPIRTVFVTESNPLSQLPGLARAMEAFHRVNFKVVMDLELTDTARQADLVLPAPGVFETPDVIYNAMNYHLLYAPALVEPPGEILSEATVFGELASRLDVRDFPQKSPLEWLQEMLRPAAERGLDFEKLLRQPQRNPLVQDVAWSDLNFATPSGKVELYSAQALEQGLSALPEYFPNKEIDRPDLAREYPLVLLTPHPQQQLHSQFFEELKDQGLRPRVLVHPETARLRTLRPFCAVLVETPRGQMEALVVPDPKVPRGLAVVEEGRPLSQGGGVNLLTPDTVSPLGETAAYYDCRCEIRGLES